MTEQIFLKGLPLLALARRKAAALGIDAGNAKLIDLVHLVQEREGHTACFRKRRDCSYRSCCWQGSCGAIMHGD